MKNNIIKDFMDFRGKLCVPTVVKVIKCPDGTTKHLASYYVILDFKDKGTINIVGQHSTVEVDRDELKSYINTKYAKCIMNCIMSIFKGSSTFHNLCKSMRIGAPKEHTSLEVWDGYKRFDEKQLWISFINKIKAQKEINHV